MITNFLLVFGVIMMISGVFSYKQIKVTSNAYIELKKNGKLVVGERRFLLFITSKVVAFAVTDNNRINKAVEISGILPFQRIQETELTPYIGKKFVRSMDPQQLGVDIATARVVSNMIRKYTR